MNAPQKPDHAFAIVMFVLGTVAGILAFSLARSAELGWISDERDRLAAKEERINSTNRQLKHIADNALEVMEACFKRKR